MKKKFLWSLFIFILVVVGYYGYKKYKNSDQPSLSIYEALIQVVDQKNSNAEEDARSSLKKGDVIAIFPEGHSWSETEKVSYLILKLKLSEEEAKNLMKAETEEGDNKLPDGGREQEVVRARAYRLKVEKLKYDPQKISEGQPYRDKVFDDSLVEKK